MLNAFDEALTSGANFRSFFEWYRNREDLENEQIRDKGYMYQDFQLRAVRKAISAFLPGVSGISVKRSPLRMELVKNDIKLRVDQLSDGEKCLFALVGDLSRRLAIANPTKEDPLNGDGVVLVDEIDLHLHPSWQRLIVSRLQDTFPNCQFVLSTHSPQVFGEVDPECIHLLNVGSDGNLSAYRPTQSFGLESSAILEGPMETAIRNHQVEEMIHNIYTLIDDENYAEARKAICRAKKVLKGDVPQLIKATSLIYMLEGNK